MTMTTRIEYSDKYADDSHEYRHVILPKEVAKTMPKSRLLSETEWRAMGVQQSRGWQHYAIHRYVYTDFAPLKRRFRPSGQLFTLLLGVWIIHLLTHRALNNQNRPEPHILLFRRPLGTDPQTGQVDPALLQLALEDYKDQPGLSHQAIMN